MTQKLLAFGVVCVLPAVLASCARVKAVVGAGPEPAPVSATTNDNGNGNGDSHAETIAEAMRRARAAVPAAPTAVRPMTARGARIWRQAMASRGMRILVSTEARALWLMRDENVLLRAPVAVGMSEGFTWEGKRFDFNTPLSIRKIMSKDTVPIWTPPDWHYFEIALEKKLKLVNLKRGQRVNLRDGSRLEIRGKDVGRVNQFGNFWAFTPGMEIIFDGKIFVPPIDTRQRKIPDVLGTHKLAMGDGYLIHGTNSELSIGDAVSHGCVRMFNEDVAELYARVPVGTPIYIF
jgi:lipoprotein-anchoring transpeptidase ErfK/SrfK